VPKNCVRAHATAIGYIFESADDRDLNESNRTRVTRFGHFEPNGHVNAVPSWIQNQVANRKIVGQLIKLQAMAKKI